LAGGTEVLAEKRPQNHFVYQKSFRIRPWIEPWAPLWKAGHKPPELRHGPLRLYTVGDNVINKLVRMWSRRVIV
jgi:hypothetical protein